MIFPGYWVDGRGSDVTVQTAEFDDTDLSPASDWKEAHQNVDPDAPGGFIEPMAMLREVCIRLLDGEDPDQLRLVQTVAVPTPIRSTADLARLVLHATLARG